MIHDPRKPRPEPETTLSGVPRVVGVAPEGPAEHIRNALAILTLNGEGGLALQDVEAVAARLRTALAQFEAPTPRTTTARRTQ